MLGFVRHEKDGLTRMLVSNSGSKAAWITRIDFCEAAALALTLDDGNTIYAWDYANKRLDFNSRSQISMATFGHVPEGLRLDCFRHYGPEALPLVSSNRVVEPGEAIEILVQSPKGFELRSSVDRGAYGYNLKCLATLVTVDRYDGARTMIACFPEDPQSYEKRWLDYVERHNPKFSPPSDEP